jgi:hypothetical protein
MIKFCEQNLHVKLVFEITQKLLDEDIILQIRDLLKLKKNVYLDRTVMKLSFSGKEPRKRLIKYLDTHSMKSRKRIVYIK